MSHWRNPKPGACAIVVDDGRVLLARRAYAPWRDAWGAPGGFVDVGEHPIETVEREVFEETGVRVDVTGYLGVWVDDYADVPGQPGAEIINVAYYLARPLAGGNSEYDEDEVSEIGWFRHDDLPSPLAPPGTLESVLAAMRNGEPTPILDR